MKLDVLAIKKWSSELFSSYPPELKGVIYALTTIETVRALLIRLINSNHFKSVHIAWSDKLVSAASFVHPSKILLNSSLLNIYKDKELRSCAIVSYIISELFQMVQKTSFKGIQKAIKRRIKQNRPVHLDKYVRKTEKLHFKALTKTSSLINKMVQTGEMLPSTPNRYVAGNFEDYYLLQQCSGHTEQIARSYRKICGTKPYLPYRGTWPQKVQPDEVRYLQTYFLCKIKMGIPSEKEEAVQVMSQLKKDIEMNSNLDFSSRVLTHFQKLDSQE